MIVLELVRAAALVLLAVAAGMSIRYMRNRPEPPPLVKAGLLVYAVTLFGTEISLIFPPDDPFAWWASPFVIAASLLIIIGLSRHVEIVWNHKKETPCSP